MARKKKTKQTPFQPLKEREIALSEVRHQLDASLEKLKQFEDFDRIANSPLAEFWQPGQPAAPFEELFTLKQMREIDVDTFFKKRSVMPGKILAIIAALENAMRVTGSAKQRTSTKRKPAKGKSVKVAAKGKTADAKNEELLKYHLLQCEMLELKCRQINQLLQLVEISGFAARAPSLLARYGEVDKILSAIHAELAND